MLILEVRPLIYPFELHLIFIPSSVNNFRERYNSEFFESLCNLYFIRFRKYLSGFVLPLTFYKASILYFGLRLIRNLSRKKTVKNSLTLLFSVLNIFLLLIRVNIIAKSLFLTTMLYVRTCS